MVQKKRIFNKNETKLRNKGTVEFLTIIENEGADRSSISSSHSILKSKAPSLSGYELSASSKKLKTNKCLIENKVAFKV